jgi:hypothetical protein
MGSRPDSRQFVGSKYGNVKEPWVRMKVLAQNKHTTRFGVLAWLFTLCVSPLCAANLGEVPIPLSYNRQVKRGITGSTPFTMVKNGHPAFALFVSDKNDLILETAAEDFARYFQERWGVSPRVLSGRGTIDENLIVLASVRSRSQLPKPLRDAVADVKGLAAQGYMIRHVQLPNHHSALVCLGGTAIGARYVTVDLLRRMRMSGGKGTVYFDRLWDEPYSTWRVLYINDSAHQMNNYNPNLIYDVQTFRWSLPHWKRFIDQLAFFRFNVLQIWITPNMFSPEALTGGGAFTYFRNTMRAVGAYAKARGIALSLLNGINVSVEAGTRLDTLSLFKDLPVYTYLSPNKPSEKALSMRLWDYWTKAIPEVGIWSLFPGDPGGCMEQGCSPDTYVDLALEVSRIIKKNNPAAQVDFTTWHFFGWGPDFTYHEYDKNHRVDRGYEYLMSKLGEFPPDTTFGINLNDFTSAGAVPGLPNTGSTVKYIDAISKKHLVHTWTYFATEGEGWIDPHYRVPQIIKERDTEARFPISGGICFTMTPSLQLLNEFTCAEAYWNPKVSVASVMRDFTDGIFGTSQQSVIDIFPTFEIAPAVGYTFAREPNWHPNYAKIRASMGHANAVLESLNLPAEPRFDIFITPKEYQEELLYFCNLYSRLCVLGSKVAECRALVRRQPGFRPKPLHDITINDAESVLPKMKEAEKQRLQSLLDEIRGMNVPGMVAQYRSMHYQVFLDHPTEFTRLLPRLIYGFFSAFGGDFVPWGERRLWK